MAVPIQWQFSGNKASAIATDKNAKYQLVIFSSGNSVYYLHITSCTTTFYQVYTVETANAKQVDNSLVFENEDCKVYYNLWSNKGEACFIYKNKTDKDIFINLGQTFFIKNGLATDYYQNRTYGGRLYYDQITMTLGDTNAKLNGKGFWGDNTYMEDLSVIGNIKSLKKAETNAHAATIKEKEIVCVPARCFKVFKNYRVDPTFLVTCNKGKDYPKEEAEISVYNKNNTPLVFTNRISYGFTKDAIAEKHIDNTFWISAIKNYSPKAATEYVAYDKDICDKDNRSNKFGLQWKVRQFKIGGPNKFYIYYTK